ncbi:hypothetical protein TNCV_4204021 [Trichonephila clavipes]|nr:hypothetical protein TNCV_4204021 [Trichonephila clavipes]
MVGENLLVHKALDEAKNSLFQEETVGSQAKCFQWDKGRHKRFISWQVASFANLFALSIQRFPAMSPNILHAGTCLGRKIFGSTN